MSDVQNLNEAAQDAAKEAALQALAPLALELGITDLSGINDISDLFEQWANNTRDVSLFALVGMGVQAAGLTRDGAWIETFSEQGAIKLKMIGDKLVQAGKVFGEEFANDPELQQALAQLDIVQKVLLPTISAIMEVYNNINEVIIELEPFIPYIELLVTATMIWINPPAATAFGNDSFKLAMKELAKVTRLLYADLKKWMISQTFPVPEILLGLTDGVLDPTSGLDAYAEAAAAAAGIGDLDLNWQNASGDLSLMNIANTLLGENPPAWASASLATLDKIYTRYGVAALAWFSNFYENLLAQGLLTSHDVVKIPLTSADIVRYSKNIVDLLTELQNQSYSNSGMLQIACNKLAQDGVIVDYGTLSYDEHKTEKGGEGLRKRFFTINTKINNYHDIIKVLKGELRFNLTEKIPVIDFYNEYFSLQQYYVDNEQTQVADLNVVDELSELYDQNNGFHEAILNLALKNGTPFEEMFYLPDYVNINVDSDGVSGPPFLAGRFSDSPERDTNNNISSWPLVDDTALALAEPYLTEIEIGTQFHPYYLDDSGWYVERPLATAEPGYSGLAQFIRDQAIASIENFNTLYNNPNWENEDSGRISQVFYKDQDSFPMLRTLDDMETFHSAWTSHLVSGEFLLDRDANSSMVKYEAIRIPRRSNSDSSYYVNKFLSTFFTKYLSKFFAGSKNLFAISCVTSPYVGGSLSIRHLETYSPIDILYRCATVDNPLSYLKGRVNPDAAFIYSAGTFSQETRVVKTTKRVKGKWNKFWRKLTGKKTTKTIYTTVVVDAARRALDPTLYLVKKTAIANLSINDSLFFYGKEDSKDKVLGFEVTGVYNYEMPATTRVKVNSSYEATQASVGTPCYVYKLEALSLETMDFNPFCYPYEDFTYVADGVVNFSWSGLQEISSFIYRKGLPPKVNDLYQGRIQPNSPIEVSALENVMGTTAIAMTIRKHIMDKPLIQKSEGDSTVIVSLKNSMEIFEVLSRNVNLIKNLPIEGSEIVLNYATRWASYARALRRLDSIANFSADNVIALDNLFGNTYIDGNGLTQPVKPWLETNPEDPLYISATLFSDITRHLIAELQGPSNTLKRVRDGSLQGNTDSLYYQRYMILNQRMNKSSGEMYQVANLERSSVVLNNNSLNIRDRLEILRVDIDALPIKRMQDVVFINDKFIDSVKYDMVRKGIGDNCLLTCGKCLVKSVCPYYDEREVILTMLNSEETLSIYLKDNKLDLVQKIVHPDWGTPEMENYRSKHYAYAEIDSGDVQLIDDLVDTIVDIQPIFMEEENTPFDDLGWITKARYGHLDLKDPKSLTTNSYMYDAMFISDEETSFSYSPGAEFKIGDYQIQLREANGIKAFSSNDEIYLVCDDSYDPIYLGKLEDLDLQIQNPQATKHYAQACLNLLDIQNANQAWAESYEYEGVAYTGRLRFKSKVELIGDGSYTQESILAGKPNMRSYKDFAREVKIPFDKIQWASSGKAEDIITAKESLPFFKTNLRIVNVQM